MDLKQMEKDILRANGWKPDWRPPGVQYWRPPGVPIMCRNSYLAGMLAAARVNSRDYGFQNGKAVPVAAIRSEVRLLRKELKGGKQ